MIVCSAVLFASVSNSRREGNLPSDSSASSATRPRATRLLIVPTAQPQISAALILAILKHAAQNPESICQPSVEERSKHPVIIPRKIFFELATTNDATLRDFLAGTEAPRSFLEVADDTLNIDLDSPADYALATERFVRKKRDWSEPADQRTL